MQYVHLLLFAALVDQMNATDLSVLYDQVRRELQELTDRNILQGFALGVKSPQNLASGSGDRRGRAGCGCGCVRLLGRR